MEQVFAYHAPTTCYYQSTVVAFNKSTLTYTVEWADGGACFFS